MSKKALIIIDMLHDFVAEGAPLYVRGASDIVDCIKKEIQKAHAEGYPVLYLCDRHACDDAEFKVWPPHAVSGTEGAEIIEEIAPREKDYVVAKTTYSSFYATELENILRHENVDEIIVTGVCTEICVLYTAVDGFMRGYKVTVPDGCTKGLTEEDHDFALKQIRHILKPVQH